MSNDLPRTFGNYSLLKLLARGGMGEIYLARTSGINAFEKYYAVKKLLKKFTHDNDVGARFIDEAKLGARLQHPNIVQVYDLGKVTDELYMATEFVDGFDLRRVLRFCHEKKKRIPLDIALFLVREILSGLAYAHRQVDAEGQSINLIHRDISPQNVLVSFEGEVKIIDFGLAKSTQRSQETQANVLLGNFGYMSPEQARGHQLDVRTDVYSAGIVLFELITGTKRFVEENPLRLLEMVARPTPIMPSDRVPGLPKAIDRLYALATAPSREDRYESAEAFRDDVTACLHKINPKATREHLAQFLNHLFLGGQPPPPVDPDLLNQSVALHVQQLYAATEAFNRPKEADVRDRNLAEFSDEAPQTGSHALMRAARVGDVLSHRELCGEEEVADEPMQLAADALLPVHEQPNAFAAPAPPMEMLEPMEMGDLALEDVELKMDDEAQGVIPDASAFADDSDATSERTGVENSWAQMPSSVPSEAAEPLAGTPTSVYSSPAVPNQLDREVVRRSSAPTETAMPAWKEPAAPSAGATGAGAASTSGHAMSAKTLTMQVVDPPRSSQLEDSGIVERDTMPPPPPSTGAPGSPWPVGTAASPPQAPSPQASQSSFKNAVVTTIQQKTKAPPPREEQPSIVIDLGSDEPTMVGASMPSPSYASMPSQAPPSTPRPTPTRRAPVGESPPPEATLAAAETMVRGPKASAQDKGGFGEGGTHDSLIIDFDDPSSEEAAGRAEATQRNPPAPQRSGEPTPQRRPDPGGAEGPSIRPAAQPLGKRVVPAVAQARPRPRGASEEGPVAPMPPPNRRR